MSIIPLTRWAMGPDRWRRGGRRLGRGGARAGEGPTGRDGDPEAGVDLNAASRQELEVLPCIGPTLAARIIERRPSRSVEELVEVKGIGSKTVKRLRPQV